MNVRESQHRWIQMSGTPIQHILKAFKAEIWKSCGGFCCSGAFICQFFNAGCNDSFDSSFSVTVAALKVSLFWQQSICWGEDSSVLFVCCYQQGWDTCHSVLNGVPNVVALGFCKEWGERSIRGIRSDKLTDLHRKHWAWEAIGESELDLTICW